jgi:uncharacterized protein (TIGR00299 family) protein
MSATRHIHLDPIGGVAGDMFIAALLDAFPEFEAGAIDAMRRAGLPATWRVTRAPDRRKGMAGSRLLFEAADGAAEGPGFNTYTALAEMIGAADLPGRVRERALEILAILGRAEAKVHGIGIERVHFHELAGWDSLADVVGAAWLIERVDAAGWSCAPLPLGRGRVRTSHGPLPIPAPATVEILHGFPLIDDGIDGERVTPTGAAILKSLQPEFAALPPGARLEVSGTGLGTREFEEIANCLRLLVFASAADLPEAITRDQVGVIEFYVDDQTPEDLAIAVGRLLDLAGVLDLQQSAAVGRKGRLGHNLLVLCRPGVIEAAAEACLAEFATIGLRTRVSERRILVRAEQERGTMTVKSVTRPGGGETSKLAADEVAAGGGDYAARMALRRRLEDDGP